MYIAILGRQPAIGIAELERLYGDVTWFSDQTAIINTPSFDFERLGGTQKAGEIIAELPHGDWRRVSMKIVQHYVDVWQHYGSKITLGISAYGFSESPRDIQKTGIILKGKLKQHGVSLRLIPNSEAVLSTATSHHNKLGLSDNKVELLVVKSKTGKIVIAESIGAQNITAYARRDQERPKRDAFVGMLPPKLAQIMINLATTPELSSALKQANLRRNATDDPSLYSAKLAYTQTFSNSQEESSIASGQTAGVPSSDNSPAASNIPQSSRSTTKPVETSAARVTRDGATPPEPNGVSEGGVARTAGPAISDLRADSNGIGDNGSGVGAHIDSQREAVSKDFGDEKANRRILDPFCGTGVILQEAALMGYAVYGTDLSDKMIDYSETNLRWLDETHHISVHSTLKQGDATTTTWQQPIDAVVCETYLGQPFSAPPSPAKLTEVRGNCNHIIGTFLKNISKQLQSGTPLCIAVPAWKAVDGTFTHLPLIHELDQLGYDQATFKTIRDGELLYYREDQIVARELLVLVKS